jgi:hypothetical protein
LRRKNFMIPAPSAATPRMMTLANFRTMAPISASSPSFLTATPPTRASRPYSATRSVLELKSS